MNISEVLIVFFTYALLLYSFRILFVLSLDFYFVETDDLMLELDEDFEGLQSTIYFLQQQLKDTKDRLQSSTTAYEQLKTEFNTQQRLLSELREQQTIRTQHNGSSNHFNSYSNSEDQEMISPPASPEHVSSTNGSNRDLTARLTDSMDVSESSNYQCPPQTPHSNCVNRTTDRTTDRTSERTSDRIHEHHELLQRTGKLNDDMKTVEKTNGELAEPKD